MNQTEKELFAFLIGNMKQMEIELRAHSIVFEAVVQKVIPAEKMGAMLEAARNSREMLLFVEEKYSLLRKSEVQRSQGDAGRIAGEDHRVIIH